MVTVVIDANRGAERLPDLLTALTPAAVDGVVREAIIAGGGPDDLLKVLREETGAELAADLGQAIAKARFPWILAMPAKIRLRPGWAQALGALLQAGGGPAVLAGEGRGWFSKRPEAVLIEAEAARRLAHPDLQDIRRALGRGRVRRLG